MESSKSVALSSSSCDIGFDSWLRSLSLTLSLVSQAEHALCKLPLAIATPSHDSNSFPDLLGRDSAVQCAPSHPPPSLPTSPPPRPFLSPMSSAFTSLSWCVRPFFFLTLYHSDAHHCRRWREGRRRRAFRLGILQTSRCCIGEARCVELRPRGCAGAWALLHASSRP